MRVFIGKTPWTVSSVEDIADALEAMSGRSIKGIDLRTLGYTDTTHKIIFLKQRKSAQQLASTYFHELLHAACPEMSEKRVYHLHQYPKKMPK